MGWNLTRSSCLLVEALIKQPLLRVGRMLTASSHVVSGMGDQQPEELKMLVTSIVASPVPSTKGLYLSIIAKP